MAMLARTLSTTFTKSALLASTTAFVMAFAESAAADDAMVTKAPAIPFTGPAYNWNGFYAGGHMGYAWGSSNFTASSPGAPNVSGSVSVAQQLNDFAEAGSFFAGVQAGYNYMLPNRVLLGAEVDATFPAFPHLAGFGIGGTSNLISPTLGAETYSDNVLASGTVCGRIGYAPGHWLFYATGGFAWAYDQLSTTQLATGASESPFLLRVGFAVGVGVEAPVAPHWTARLEYLFTDYGNSGMTFFAGAQRFDSDLMLHEVRAGLNYQFGNDALPANAAPIITKAPGAPDLDILNFHGQFTFTWQGYPAMRSAFQSTNSLPAGGQGRETIDATLAHRRAAMARRRILGRSRNRSGSWSGGHPRRGGIPECRSLQVRRQLSLCARAALFCPADHRSRRREPKSGCGLPPIRRHADREPPGADRRPFRHRGPVRHQQMREQPED